MIPVTRVTNVNLPHYQHANYFYNRQNEMRSGVKNEM